MNEDILAIMSLQAMTLQMLLRISKDEFSKEERKMIQGTIENINKECMKKAKELML